MKRLGAPGPSAEEMKEAKVGHLGETASPRLLLHLLGAHADERRSIPSASELHSTCELHTQTSPAPPQDAPLSSLAVLTGCPHWQQYVRL